MRRYKFIYVSNEFLNSCLSNRIVVPEENQSKRSDPGHTPCLGQVALGSPWVSRRCICPGEPGCGPRSQDGRQWSSWPESKCKHDPSPYQARPQCWSHSVSSKGGRTLPQKEPRSDEKQRVRLGSRENSDMYWMTLDTSFIWARPPPIKWVRSFHLLWKNTEDVSCTDCMERADLTVTQQVSDLY